MEGRRPSISADLRYLAEKILLLNTTNFRGDYHGISDGLTDLLRTGAQQLIAAAVEGELESFLEQYRSTRTKTGHAAIVRNGHHAARPLQTGIGPVSVRIPKVRSKDGTTVTFRSALVPPYVRRTVLQVKH